MKKNVPIFLFCAVFSFLMMAGGPSVLASESQSRLQLQISGLETQINQLENQLKEIQRTQQYIQFVSPNGGEKIKLGSMTEIKWKSSLRKEQIGINIYEAKGDNNLTEDQMTKTLIKSCAVQDNMVQAGDSFSWGWKSGYDSLGVQLPGVLSRYYKISVFDCDNTSLKDNSDHYFQLTGGVGSNGSNSITLASIATALFQIASQIKVLFAR